MILHSPESTPGSWWFLLSSESWTERMQDSTVLAERGRRVDRRACVGPGRSGRRTASCESESEGVTFAFTLNLNFSWPSRGE
mgnify:CR=1 FL=1